MPTRERITVAIVGGGRTGTPLLENMLEFPYVDIVGIVDKDPASPGVQIARDNGIYYTADVTELAEKAREIDIIIEVSGDPSVKPALKQAFQEHGNRHTILVHDLVARLILSMGTGSNELVQTYHPEDEGIG